MKVRQPLSAAMLVSANAAVRQDLQSMASVIAEELNVKEVQVKANEEELVTLSAKPNLKRLGPKYGKKLKNLAAAITALPSDSILQVLGGGSVQVDIAGLEAVNLTSEDVLIQRSEREGLTVANEGEITVALDIRLTPSLIMEGWAREVVSKLQNLRKELGFSVTDRIVIQYDAPAEVSDAIVAQSAYICAETLAISITPGRGENMQEVEMNGVKASFSLCRAK